MLFKSIVKVGESFDISSLERVSEISGMFNSKKNKEGVTKSQQYSYVRDNEFYYYFCENSKHLDETRFFCPDCLNSFQVTNGKRITQAVNIKERVVKVHEKLTKDNAIDYYDYESYRNSKKNYCREDKSNTPLVDLLKYDINVVEKALGYLDEIIYSRKNPVFGKGIDYEDIIVNEDDGDLLCPHCKKEMKEDIIEKRRACKFNIFDKLVIRSNEARISAHFKFLICQIILPYPFTITDRPRIVVEGLDITNVFNLETGNVYNMCPQICRKGQWINLKGYKIACCNVMRESVRQHPYFDSVVIPPEAILEVGEFIEGKFKERNPYIKTFDEFVKDINYKDYKLTHIYAYNKIPWADLSKIQSIYPGRVYSVIRGISPYSDNAVSKTLERNKFPNKKSIRKAVSKNILSLSALPYFKVFKDPNNWLKLIDGTVNKYGHYSNFETIPLGASRSFMIKLIKASSSESIAANKIVNNFNVYADTINMYKKVMDFQKGKKKKDRLTDFSFFGNMNLKEIHDQLTYFCTKIDTAKINFKYDNSNIKNFKPKKFRNYSFIRTKDSHELIYYGKLLNICVGYGGYIEKMVKRNLDIIFAMQDGKPIMCIEVSKNKVQQAKCQSNRRPVGEDRKAVFEFIEHFVLDGDAYDLRADEDSNAYLYNQQDQNAVFRDNFRNNFAAYDDDLPF